MNCLFVSDLHGDTSRYEKLFSLIETTPPDAVFIGGDIFPHFMASHAFPDSPAQDFATDYLVRHLSELKGRLGAKYPEVFLILGNDDGRFEEPEVINADQKGIWHYCHQRRVDFGIYRVYGYSYVPPTPFRLKDWERYDVSRYTDPGCIPVEDGVFSRQISESDKLYRTIRDDLDEMAGGDSLERAILLFHSPPYRTNLDRAALDHRRVDHVPLDVHVGSIAVKRFIEEHQPLVSLHGHVHESARITGSWQDRIGRTYSFTAAHDGKQLAVVRFDPEYPERAERWLR